MIRYIIKRLVYAVLTLFVLISLTFFMMRMLPGNPFIGDKTVSATAMANMNAKYGLDKPVFVQYLMYMGNCLRGDLGISITYNRDVMTIISESFLVSADLGIRAIIFAVIIGILLGAVAAIKRGSVWDSVSMFIAMIGVSVPSFILGAVLQYFPRLGSCAKPSASISSRFRAGASLTRRCCLRSRWGSVRWRRFPV